MIPIAYGRLFLRKVLSTTFIAILKQDYLSWYVSTEILFEYEEIVGLTYSEQTAHLVLHTLATAPNTVFAEPAFRWELIENDPDDNKFSDLAISVNADYLVSNDTDYAIFKKIKFPSLTVIGLEEFLTLLR